MNYAAGKGLLSDLFKCLYHGDPTTDPFDGRLGTVAMKASSFLAALIFDALFSTCIGRTYSCRDDETLLNTDNCVSAPSVLSCVRRWDEQDGGVTVTFGPNDRKCCFKSRRVAVSELSAEENSTVCFAGVEEAAPTSPTTPTPPASPSTTPALPASASPAPAPPASSSEAPITGSCETNWTRIGDRCFMYVNIIDTWDGSEARCQTYGGHLAHMYSLSNFADFLPFKTPCTIESLDCLPHLGINDRDVEGTIVGVTGQDVPADILTAIYDNRDSFDCSYYGGDTGRLRFSLCHLENSSICETDLSN